MVPPEADLWSVLEGLFGYRHPLEEVAGLIADPSHPSVAPCFGSGAMTAPERRSPVVLLSERWPVSPGDQGALRAEVQYSVDGSAAQSETQLVYTDREVGITGR